MNNMNALTAVTQHLPVKVGTGDVVLGTLTESSGWVIIDAAIGAGVGWFIAPKGEESGWALGGAFAAGLAGVLGLAGLLGWRYIAAPALGGVRENPIPRLSRKQSDARYRKLKKGGCKPKRVRLPNGDVAVLRKRGCRV